MRNSMILLSLAFLSPSVFASEREILSCDSPQDSFPRVEGKLSVIETDVVMTDERFLNKIGNWVDSLRGAGISIKEYRIVGAIQLRSSDDAYDFDLKSYGRLFQTQGSNSDTPDPTLSSEVGERIVQGLRYDGGNPRLLVKNNLPVFVTLKCSGGDKLPQLKDVLPAPVKDQKVRFSCTTKPPANADDRKAETLTFIVQNPEALGDRELISQGQDADGMEIYLKSSDTDSFIQATVNAEYSASSNGRKLTVSGNSIDINLVDISVAVPKRDGESVRGSVRVEVTTDDYKYRDPMTCKTEVVR